LSAFVEFEEEEEEEEGFSAFVELRWRRVFSFCRARRRRRRIFSFCRTQEEEEFSAFVELEEEAAAEVKKSRKIRYFQS
jgi:hypothetical protein